MAKYDVISPDGFSINRNGYYKTKKEAEKAKAEYPNRFKQQGYYSSIRGQIALDELPNYCRIIRL